MINLEDGKDLFSLQTQLIDRKIELGVKKASDRIIENLVKQVTLHFDQSIDFLKDELFQQLANQEKAIRSIKTSHITVNKTEDISRYRDFTYFLLKFIASTVIFNFAISLFHNLFK